MVTVRVKLRVRVRNHSAPVFRILPTYLGLHRSLMLLLLFASFSAQYVQVSFQSYLVLPEGM